MKSKVTVSIWASIVVGIYVLLAVISGKPPQLLVAAGLYFAAVTGLGGLFSVILVIKERNLRISEEEVPLLCFAAIAVVWMAVETILSNL